MNMSKSGKSAYFCQIFATYFFCRFFKPFSTDLKSVWNSAFFIPFLIFSNFEDKRAINGLKKRETFFINMF